MLAFCFFLLYKSISSKKRSGDKAMDKDFAGVFSRTNALKTKTYYFVWISGNTFSVQRLNAFFQPTGILEKVNSFTFKRNFVHEPTIKKHPKGLVSGAAQKKSGRQASSDNVESYLRDLFRKASLRLGREHSKESALPILENLIEVEEGITKEHRHMFNDFGIEMRKNKMHRHALAFCKRTLALTESDDHAHFNAARILIEMGSYDEAEQHILTAQFLNPDSRIYKKTLEHIAMLRLQDE